MKIKANFNLSRAALLFVYTLGGCLFLFGKCGIMNMFVSFILGLVSYLVFHLLLRANTFPRAKSFFVTLLAVGTVVFTFISFAVFTNRRILFSTPRFMVVLLFCAIITAFCFSSFDAIKKFCFLFSFIALFFCLIILLAAAANFDFSNTRCLPGLSGREIARNYLIIFFPLFIPAVGEDKTLFSDMCGIFAASLIITVFSLFTVCTFGELNEKLEYPLLALSDTVNFGRIFTRLGLYLDAVIYVSGLIRCVVCIKKIKCVPLRG